MQLKNMLQWFWSTLVVGMCAVFVIGALFGLLTLHTWVKQLLFGLTLGAVAQLGFFSYLVIHGLIKEQISSGRLYQWMVGLLLVVLLGNLVYLFAHKYQGWTLVVYLLIPLIIVGASVIVAQLKVHKTNQKAFLPTLFFMMAATIIEAVPAINLKGEEAPFLVVLHTVLVLLICNAWQILRLQEWARVKK